MLVLSFFLPSHSRVIAQLARHRNEYVAHLADETWFAHAAKGGKFEEIVQPKLSVRKDMVAPALSAFEQEEPDFETIEQERNRSVSALFPGGVQHGFHILDRRVSLQEVRSGEEIASAGFADADDLAGGGVHFRRGGGFQEADLVEIA